MIEKEFISNIKENQKPDLIKSYPQSENEIQQKLSELSERITANSPPYIAFLGMGSDGHTAGIFDNYFDQSSFYSFKRESDPFSRVTISMNILKVVPNLIFFIMGQGKKAILTEILSPKLKNRLTPTSYLLKHGKGEKSIICDRSAAPDQFPLGETLIFQDNN